MTDTANAVAIRAGADYTTFRKSLAQKGGGIDTSTGEAVAPVRVKDFASADTPAGRAAGLVAALAAFDVVEVDGGVYDPVEIVASNKTLIMQAAVEFRIPDNLIGSRSVMGIAAFHVSGDNVSINGDFTVNGNKANNSSLSIPTTVRVGTCYVTGNDVRFNDEVYVKNAYWIGFSAEERANTTTEIKGLYVNRLRVENADYHSVMIWSVSEWRIDEITAKGGIVGKWIYGTKDQRVRLGTQGANTSKCRNGSVGRIFTDRHITLTLENGISAVAVENAVCGAGGKIQNADKIYIGSWLAQDCSVKNEAYGLAIINASDVVLGRCVVENYDCADGFAGIGFAILGAIDVRIDSIVVSGSKAQSRAARDMLITTASDLKIGSVSLVSPSGNIAGFQFDFDPAYAPQKRIFIGVLVSRGHRQWDISIDNGAPLRVDRYNGDAAFERSSELQLRLPREGGI